ncbi:M6 family metalloprotease domain-containing protein, partial [bacterium]|nr:M6 family metalloprotease domain-containing protein [bacterium]
MKQAAFFVLMTCIFAQLSLAGGEIPPRAGLYDPVTLRSTTTGDLYPIFPEDANLIPPMDPDRVDDVDQALTILIRTPDIANIHIPESFDSLLYSTGVYPSGSMNDYFLESSYGAFGVEGEVVGWVMAPENYHYYTWGNNGFASYPHNAQKLAEEAVLAADALGVDFSQYDNDNDGWVDALIIVHQGPGAENTGSVDDIWSHRWGLHDPIELDGVMVYDYCMDPELSGVGATGEIEHIGVFAHEYTHLLGLPDLYDYDSKLDPVTHYTPNDANDHPVMDWGIMGYGGYGLSSYGRGAYPNHHNAYFKYLLGWVEPVLLGLSQTGIEVPSYETNPVVYKIPINGSDTEFFLVSNVDPTNPDAIFDKYDSDFSAWFPQFTPGSNTLDAGLVISHVDEEMPLNNGWPDDPHYCCRIVDAGYTEAQVWPGIEYTEWWYPYEFRVGAAFSAEDSQDELTPESDPSSDGYYGPSGIRITNISNSGPLMTFDLEYSGGSPDFEYAGYLVENDGRDEDG